MNNKVIGLLIVAFLFSSPLLAESDHHEHDDHEEEAFEEHSSHVHGHATAQVTFAHGVLTIKKTLSSIDVFGFEHTPKNDEQKNIINQAVNMMQTAESIFGFEESVCELESVKIESVLIESETEEHHEHHEHEEEHHSEVTEEDSHSDVVANYAFKCDQNALKTINFLMFDHFPSLEEIEVQYVSDEHQSLFNATPSNHLFNLN